MEMKWVLEEARLWAEIFAKPETSSRAKNARAAERARRAGRKPPVLITEEQAVARSWAAYARWLEH